jgi:hypothetical protein
MRGGVVDVAEDPAEVAGVLASLRARTVGGRQRDRKPAEATGDGQAVGKEVTFADQVVLTCRDVPKFTEMSLGTVLRATDAAGFEQVVDLACGFPTPKIGTVHQAAQKANPEARTFYVDKNDRAVAETRLLTLHDPNTVVLCQDITHVGKLIKALTDPSQTIQLDFDRPMLVIFGLVTHLLDDSTATRVMRELYARMPVGSRWVMTAPTSDTKGELRDQMKALIHLYKKGLGVTWYLRDLVGLARILPARADLVQPWELYPDLEPMADLTADDRKRLHNAIVAAEVHRT